MPAVLLALLKGIIILALESAVAEWVKNKVTTAIKKRNKK